MADIIVIGKFPEPDFIEFTNGYRGVNRMYINYPFEFYGTSHKILEINDKYESLTETDCFLHDINFARNLRDIYNEVYPEVEREIIEVVFNNEHSELNGVFLGFDIVDVSDSNILRVILVTTQKDSKEEAETFSKVLSLISKNMLRLLNENQLFKTFEDAAMALNLIEGSFAIFGHTSFHRNHEVVKVYLVE